jgi:hypothetical protein
MTSPLTRHAGGRCGSCGNNKGKVRYTNDDGEQICPWCAKAKGLINQERLQADALEDMFLRAGIYKGPPGDRPFAFLKPGRLKQE